MEIMEIMERDLIICSSLLPYCESLLTIMNIILDKTEKYFAKQLERQYFACPTKQQNVVQVFVTWILAINRAAIQCPNEKNCTFGRY